MDRLAGQADVFDLEAAVNELGDRLDQVGSVDRVDECLRARPDDEAVVGDPATSHPYERHELAEHRAELDDRGSEAAGCEAPSRRLFLSEDGLGTQSHRYDKTGDSSHRSIRQKDGAARGIRRCSK